MHVSPLQVLDDRAAVRAATEAESVTCRRRWPACRGVVVCTTNLRENLDPAALRRFTLKIEFGLLKPQAAQKLFVSRLVPLLDEPQIADLSEGIAVALRNLPPLTPGDFGAVQRRLLALGERVTLTRMLALLEAEALERKRPPRTAGFSAEEVREPPRSVIAR